MTLAVAWFRKQATTEEVVVAADSRLRFGCAWDGCPKIVPLPRGDAVLCFAGQTEHAYPTMLQLHNAVAMHDKVLSRGLDLTDLRGHFIRLMSDMRQHIHDLPKGQSKAHPPQVRFILAGYSWRFARFYIWVVNYNLRSGRYAFDTVRTANRNPMSRFVFIGDETKRAKDTLYEALRADGRLKGDGLDMEPFVVLRDFIRSGKYPSIGGPPQLCKVYRHPNATPIGVYWDINGSRRMTLLGRPLMDYETHRYLVLDPDTLKTAMPR